MYCSNCGKKLNDDAKFCDGCGAKVEKNSESVKDGKVFKCPYCGEILSFDAVVCPTCRNELRGKNVVYSLEKFIEKLESCEDQSKKPDLIRNFPIPNSREDIIEFMVLASTNYYSPVNTGEYRAAEISAWRTKMDQCHAKAHILLKNPLDLKQIDTLYYGKAGKSENSGKPSNTPLKPPGVAPRVLGMLCVVLTVLSFIAGISVVAYSGANIKKPVTFDINPTILKESSALESDKSLVLVSEIRESYYLSVTFSSNQDAEIGNYVEDDYLYHAFGGITNKFTVTIDIYNSKTNTLFHDYHSLDIELRKGNKTYNSKVSSLDIETNRNVVTYSYTDDIYIYSLTVVINFEGLSVLGYVGVALSMLSILGFLPFAIALNVVASVRNKKYKKYISNSSLGREEYIQRQEEAKKRRKKTDRT